MATEVYISNDNLVTLDDLQNATTSGNINDATVTYTLKTTAGAVVDSAASSVSMAYVSGSSGKYRGTLADTVTTALTNNQIYHLFVDADGGAGLRGHWRIRVRGDWRD